MTSQQVPRPAGGVRLRMLGPLECHIDDVAIPLGGPRQRAVLALLALEANRVVPVDRIVIDLWGDEPLRQPRNNVQVYVSNLRRTLRDVGDQLSITGEGNGYRLRAADGVIDLEVFRRSVDDTRRHLERGLCDAAARCARVGLALWRGPLLADLAGEFDTITAISDRLVEEHLFATELWLDAELAAGRAASIVATLDELTSRHPLHERFWAQSMRALWGAGRQRDALQAYQRARESLADEAGLDPGPELRELEAALLAGDLPEWQPPAVPVATSSLGSSSAAASAPSTPSAASAALAVLSFTDGAGIVRCIPLRPDDEYTIGREHAVDVAVGWDGLVSRRHARLWHADGTWWIADTGSANGTFVRGRPLSSPSRLETGDVIIVGNTALSFRSTGTRRTIAWSPSEVTMIEPNGALS